MGSSISFETIKRKNIRNSVFFRKVEPIDDKLLKKILFGL